MPKKWLTNSKPPEFQRRRLPLFFLLPLLLKAGAVALPKEQEGDVVAAVAAAAVVRVFLVNWLQEEIDMC